MITIGELIQRVQSIYSKGVQSKDTRLTPRHIYSKLISSRSVLLRQQVNKKQQLSEWSYQPLPCVELVKAPVHECPCVPNNGCSILRTKYKLPKPVQALDRMMIKSVTTLDGGVAIDETTFESVKNSAGNKYTSKKPKFYPRNGYLYITMYKELKGITINGLFDDVIEAHKFPSLCGDCADCACKKVTDLEFPIDGNLVDALVQMAHTELVGIFKQMGEDNENNATDDSYSKGAMVHTAPQTDSE
jgi:hypothetical protein